MARIAKPKQDLSTLPIWIVKVNNKWWRNMKNLDWIKKEHLAKHLPKEEVVQEIKQTWHSQYENY